MGKTNLSKYERKPEIDIDLSKYERKAKGPNLYQHYENSELVPYEEFERIWNMRGLDPVKRASILDKKSYRNDKTGVTGDAYAVHDPTWTDRGKELLQGVGSGLATIPDLASNYVAAPVTFLGSKYAKGQGKLLNFIGAESAAKESNKIGEDLQNLSDKYWDQNLSDEIKNSKILATKNRDGTSSTLRGAGEFATDILPASAVGTGAKYLAKGAKVANKVAKPVVKGLRNKVAQWWKEPKLPKIANLLETPLTGKNTAAFAGAGAGHGWVNSHYGEKKKSGGLLYDLVSDMPIMMTGAGIAGGAYGGIKGLGKLGVNAIKGTKSSANKVPAYYESLAKKINKGNNELDEEFIKAVEGTDIDLTPFNIYKDNEVPFNLTKNNSEKEYLNILPKLKRGIHDETEKLLDKNLVKYDKDDPMSDISHSSELIRELLKNSDANSRSIAKSKYEHVENDILDKFNLPANNLLQKAKDIVKTTSGVSSGNTGGNNIVNKIADDIIKTLGEKPTGKSNSSKSKRNVVPLRNLYVERKDLNYYLSKAYAKKNPLDENQKRLIKELKDSIDTDIHHAYENKKIPKDWYANFIDANTYHRTNRGPFKESKLFRKIDKNKYDEGEIVDALNNNNKYEDLNQLLDLVKNQNLDKNNGKIVSLKENDIKSTTNWLKRLELQRELFDRMDGNDYSLAHLKKKLKGAKSDNPLYNYKNKNKNKNKDIDLAEELRGKISPIIKKYEDVLHKDKYYKGGLNGLNNPTYYGDLHGTINKFMRPASLHYSGGVLGAGLGGSVAGPVGATLGGLAGAGIGHVVNIRHSAKVMKAMTDKQFVNELIRLGRLPKAEKDSIMLALAKRPVLKTEIVKLLFKKDDEKTN